MASNTGQNRRPVGLNARGREFWDHIVAEYAPTAAELQLVVEVARTLDTCERLAREARGEDDARLRLSLDRELRQQRLAAGRLLAQLGVEDDHGDSMPSPRQVRGRHAANVRWSGSRA